MKHLVASVMCAIALAACASTAAAPAAGSQAAIEEQTRAMSATPGVLMVRIGVTDLDRAAGFYTEVFGMTASPFGPHERSMAHPNGGAGILLYHNASAGPQPSWASNGLIMRVADADDTVRRAQAAGGQVRGAVQDIPQMNMRVVGIIDPDGTFIEVVQAAAR